MDEMDPTKLGVKRLENRAALAAVALRFLGTEHGQDHAARLAGIVEPLLEELRVAASGIIFFEPNATPEQIREQMREHSRHLMEVAHNVAVKAMMAALAAGTCEGQLWGLPKRRT